LPTRAPPGTSKNHPPATAVLAARPAAPLTAYDQNVAEQVLTCWRGDRNGGRPGDLPLLPGGHLSAGFPGDELTARRVRRPGTPWNATTPAKTGRHRPPDHHHDLPFTPWAGRNATWPGDHPGCRPSPEPACESAPARPARSCSSGRRATTPGASHPAAVIRALLAKRRRHASSCPVPRVKPWRSYFHS